MEAKNKQRRLDTNKHHVNKTFEEKDTSIKVTLPPALYYHGDNYLLQAATLLGTLNEVIEADSHYRAKIRRTGKLDRRLNVRIGSRMQCKNVIVCCSVHVGAA